MLSKANRLKKSKDFERVFKKGKGFKETFLFFKVAKNNLEVSRFGFIISKRFSKKAFLRNKIKRRLRELIRVKLPEIKKGFDGIFIIEKELGRKNFQELGEIIDKLFKKAKLIN